MMKPLAVAVLGVLAAGCSGVAPGPASGEVSGIVTWVNGGGMPMGLPRVAVFDSTLGRHVLKTIEVGAPLPREAPRAGIVVQARPRYRGGLLQRFRWQSARPVAEAVTDSTGRYDLRVPPGRYLVTARYPSSFECDNSTGVLVGGGLTVADRIAWGFAIEVSRGEVAERDFRIGPDCPV